MRIREEDILKLGKGPLANFPKESESKPTTFAERPTQKRNILQLEKGPLAGYPEDTDYPRTSRATFADEQGEINKNALFQPKNQSPKVLFVEKTQPTSEIKRGEQGLREREFKYNVYDDPLYQQYIASARRNGQNAMTDTMAKVASQTGGIAGSYAVAAGAGAYNDYMERANDIIPELEQLAYQKYQDELARDREIYKMDEAKRYEDAERNSIINNYQSYGKELTPEERATIYAGGLWLDGEDIVGKNGERYVRGTKAADEELIKAKDAYEIYGWTGLTASQQDALYNAGYKFNDAEGMMQGPDGTLYKTGGMQPLAEALLVWQTGGNILNYIPELEKAGYTYDAINNKLYDPEGNPVKNRDDVNEEKELIKAKDAYEIYGWTGLTASQQNVLYDAGYKFNDAEGMMQGPDGTLYKTGYKFNSLIGNILNPSTGKSLSGNILNPSTGKTQDSNDNLSKALLVWQTGGNILNYVPELEKAGYTYDAINDKLYDPEGNPVKNRDDVNEEKELITIENKIARGKTLSDNDYETLFDAGFIYYSLGEKNLWKNATTGETLTEYVRRLQGHTSNSDENTGNQQPDHAWYVSPTETLSDIAYQYGMSADELAEYNGIKDANKIYAGQVILIPGNVERVRYTNTTHSGNKTNNTETPKPVTGITSKSDVESTVNAALVQGNKDYAMQVLVDAEEHGIITPKEVDEIIDKLFDTITE